MIARPEITVEDPWERFRRLPSAYAHASRIAAAFDEAIDDKAASGVASKRRIASRLSAHLERRLVLPDAPPPADPRDRAIALMSADRLAALARQAGAVCWAGAVAREIHAERVAALREAIGDDAYTAALGHRAQALEAEALGAEAPKDPQALAAVIESDGEGCLEAWLRSQTEGVAARIRLRWPADRPSADPRGELLEAGPRILRTLAS